jgi:hypothetical protein
MSHLRLVPPLAPQPVAAPAHTYDDPKVVALAFFQSASGLCLCRECSMKRHPAYAAR